MVERVLSVDACEAEQGRYTGAPARHGAPQAMVQREIEGIGGRAWYEGQCVMRGWSLHRPLRH